ncbi:hypothetical protein L1887_15459 [Cichorium endivia]|nr:hypothetical protein L1887_15459 [Cichorium endivia]
MVESRPHPPPIEITRSPPPPAEITSSPLSDRGSDIKEQVVTQGQKKMRQKQSISLHRQNDLSPISHRRSIRLITAPILSLKQSISFAGLIVDCRFMFRIPVISYAHQLFVKLPLLVIVIEFLICSDYSFPSQIDV